MSLYNDLNEVLTPYAAKIKEVNESLNDIIDYVGMPYTRQAVTADLQSLSQNGVYEINSDGNLICTTAPSDSKAEIIKFTNAIALDYDANDSENETKPSRITLAVNGNNRYYSFKFTAGKKITAIHCLSTGAVSGGSAVSGYTWNESFGSDVYLSHVHVEKTGDGIKVVVTDTASVTYTHVIPYSAIGATYDTSFLAISNITTGLNTISTNVRIISNVQLTFAGESTDAESPLYGKTWDVWGDSYSAPADYDKYMDIIADETGCTVVNRAVSGHNAAEIISDTEAVSTTTSSIITCLLGVNDYLDSVATATFRTNIQTLITTFMTQNINANIGIIATTQEGQSATGTGDCTTANSEGATLEDYVDIIKEVCAENGVPCLDLYHEGQFYGRVATFQSAYMSTDLLHPNAAGHIRLAGVIKKWMENILVL